MNTELLVLSTNDLTIVRKEEPAYFGASDSSGLHAVITNGASSSKKKMEILRFI